MKMIGVTPGVIGLALGAFVLTQTAMTVDVDAQTIVNYRSASDLEVIFGGEGQIDGKASDGHSGKSGGGAAHGGGGFAGSSGSSGSSGSESAGASGGVAGIGGGTGGGLSGPGNAGNAGGVGTSASGGMIAHFFRNLLAR